MRRLLFGAMVAVAGSLVFTAAAHADWDHDWGDRHGLDHRHDWNWHRQQEWREREAREHAYQQGFANGWAERREHDRRRFQPAAPPELPRSYYYFGFGQRR